MSQREKQFQVNNIRNTKKESLQGESERETQRFFQKQKEGHSHLLQGPPHPAPQWLEALQKPALLSLSEQKDVFIGIHSFERKLNESPVKISFLR